MFFKCKQAINTDHKINQKFPLPLKQPYNDFFSQPRLAACNSIDEQELKIVLLGNFYQLTNSLIAKK